MPVTAYDGPVWIAGSNLVRYDAAKSAASGGTWVNDGVCSFIFKNSSGATLQGSTSMPYVSGSNGRYEGVLTAASTSGLTVNATYYVEITFARGGSTDLRTLTLKAQKRATY